MSVLRKSRKWYCLENIPGASIFVGICNLKDCEILDDEVVEFFEILSDSRFWAFGILSFRDFQPSRFCFFEILLQCPFKLLRQARTKNSVKVPQISPKTTNFHLLRNPPIIATQTIKPNPEKETQYCISFSLNILRRSLFFIFICDLLIGIFIC